MYHTFEHTRKIVTTKRVTVVFPQWMAYAIEGRKIDAIKSLRTTAGLSIQGDQRVGLIQAKRIVEEFCSALDA